MHKDKKIPCQCIQYIYLAFGGERKAYPEETLWIASNIPATPIQEIDTVYRKGLNGYLTNAYFCDIARDRDNEIYTRENHIFK